MDASLAEAAEERRQFLQEAAVFVRAGEHKNLLRFYGRCEPDKRSAATRDLRACCATRPCGCSRPEPVLHSAAEALTR